MMRFLAGLALVIGSVGLLPAQAPSHLTAQQIVNLIQQHTNVSWSGPTVDTFKAGDPNTPVTGVATTMMATFDVLQRAAAQNANLVITHEPTFYNHLDKTEEFSSANDPVWSQKEAFIREHHMVVWRFHDHWHQMTPDGILAGMTRALGWQQYQEKTAPGLFVIPQVTLDELGKQIQQRIGMRVIRVVGDPKMMVSRIALVPGAAGPQRQIPVLRRDGVDVLVIGEVPEWETVEYAADASAEGRKKALMLMGHIPSEQAGMADCATWLKTFLPGIPVTFVPTAEPFWLP